jgi:hypothetical protein
MPQTSFKSKNGQRLFLIVSVLIFALATAGRSEQTGTNEQTVDVEGLFSFRLPPDWSRRSSFNVAEVRGEWANDGTKLVYVWGQTASGSYSERRQSWMNEYEETRTRLGGRRADIRSFSRVKDGKRMYHAELNVGNWEKGEVQLYMRIEGSDSKTLDLAKEIFKSVTFPLASPERPTPR